MKKRSRRPGCVFAGLLILVTLGIGSAWWFLRSQIPIAEGPPSSPVQVFLLSPSSGDEVAAGDFVPVALQASAPGGIASSELFMDGESLGMVSDSPESASWTWQAWPAGVHTLSARATSGEGQVGQSQTVILNVLVASDTMQVLPGPGETLTQVGAQYGVPPDEMAGANPHVDPSKPLPDGQPVDVPTGGGAGGGGAQPPGGDDPGGGTIPFSILWELKLTKPADLSYCYLSKGDGVWDKLPKPPFDFFHSLNNLYTQIFESIPQEPIVLQAQCWGWVGGALEYLGDGQTAFNINDAHGPLVMSGQGFEFSGTPQWPGDMMPLAGEPPIPPPYGMREPDDSADCLAHGEYPAVCETSMNAISEIVLEWEWQPGNNWPGNPIWLNDITGYQIFELNPSNNSWKHMQNLSPAGHKATALPSEWGVSCYAVRAYAHSPQNGAIVFSSMATYCRNQPLATQKVVETPSEWITTGGEWVSNDCNVGSPTYSFGDTLAVVVGRYIWDYDGGCYEEGSYSGGVKFPLNSLPPGAVIQKASFKFSKVYVEWSATGVALPPAPETCVAAVGTSKQDWSGLDGGDHYSKTELSGIAYYSPFSSIASYMTPNVDVTPLVKNWLKFPANNHGFILIPMEAPQPDDGAGKCLSGVDGFQLEIEFFAP